MHCKSLHVLRQRATQCLTNTNITELVLLKSWYSLHSAEMYLNSKYLIIYLNDKYNSLFKLFFNHWGIKIIRHRYKTVGMGKWIINIFYINIFIKKTGQMDIIEISWIMHHPAPAPPSPVVPNLGYKILVFLLSWDSWLTSTDYT